MKKQLVEISITETACSSPRLAYQSRTFNVVKGQFGTVEEAKEWIAERYGKMPKAKRKIYTDGENGSCTEVGFLHSFWNKDWSHNSKSWFQTDWITIEHHEITPILI